MAAKTTRPEGERGKDKLGEALRGLKKLNAPWYFEAQLQQRLHSKRRFSAMPSLVPTYAMSMFVVLLAGAISYFVILKREGTLETFPVGDSTSILKNGVDVKSDIPEQNESSTDAGTLFSNPPHRKGPSAGEGLIEPKLSVSPSSVLDTTGREALRRVREAQKDSTQVDSALVHPLKGKERTRDSSSIQGMQENPGIPKKDTLGDIPTPVPTLRDSGGNR